MIWYDHAVDEQVSSSVDGALTLQVPFRFIEYAALWMGQLIFAPFVLGTPVAIAYVLRQAWIDREWTYGWVLLALVPWSLLAFVLGYAVWTTLREGWPSWRIMVSERGHIGIGTGEANWLLTKPVLVERRHVVILKSGYVGGGTPYVAIRRSALSASDLEWLRRAVERCSSGGESRAADGPDRGEAGDLA